MSAENSEPKMLDSKNHAHPLNAQSCAFNIVHPVAEKKFRIQAEIFEQMRALICPKRSNEELMAEIAMAAASGVVGGEYLWFKLNEWAHEIAVGRLTQKEQRAFRNYVGGRNGPTIAAWANSKLDRQALLMEYVKGKGEI